MEEKQELKRKTILSTLSLFFQSGYSAFLGLITNLIITILLSPAIFGMYVTLLSLLSLLNYFSDIGLAASLIQKDSITKDDVKTTFTVQLILVSCLVIIAFICTPFIVRFYDLPQTGKYLFWALLVSFVLSSLKTIPSIFLERKIQFQKIVLVQIVENTMFYGIVSILALLKFELTSFTVAVLVRSLFGLILMYYISPWTPSLGISRESLRSLVKFGLPFQASSFLALFKDDLIILFLGKVLGFHTLGYIGWAKKWAEAPIRIIMDNVSKVLFPLLARFQKDTDKLGKVIEKTIFLQSALLSPIMILSAFSMTRLIFLIPRYSKWGPALPIFFIFCCSAYLSTFSTPFINLLNAIGKASIPFSLMLFWTIATWILVPTLTHYYGMYGFPVSLLMVSSTFMLVIFLTKKSVPFQWIKSIKYPIISSIIMFVGVYFLHITLPQSILSLVFLNLAGGILYLLILQVLFSVNLIYTIRKTFFHYD